MKLRTLYPIQGLIFSCLLFSVGCLENSGGGGGSDSGRWTPDVELECSSAHSTDCSAAGDGKMAYVGLLSDTTQDCQNYLNSLTSSNFTLSFDLSGEATMSWDGFFLTGTVSHWVNSMGQPLNQIPDIDYKVCVFVDSQGTENLQLDSAEPVGQADFLTDDASRLQVVDWWDNP